MARPFWSGQLRISLVSFGINLIPASEANSEIRFHQIDRIRHQKVSAAGDEMVEKNARADGDPTKGRTGKHGLRLTPTSAHSADKRRKSA
jgi:DNA end-binding protein Ku